MIVVVITCVVVIIALVVADLRQRERSRELESEVQAAVLERDRSRDEAVAAAAAAATAEGERDDALERVSRARRDAAEVANRLSAETTARAELDDEVTSLRRALDEARSAGVDGFAEQLWELSVRQAEHTWRLSIAVDPDANSPFADSDDPFRTAVEIEIDAAREESGAVVDVEWAGTNVVEPSCAVLALAIVRDLVHRLGTTADRTTLRMDRGSEALEIAVDAVASDGAPLPVDLPEKLESAPGVARIE